MPLIGKPDAAKDIDPVEVRKALENVVTSDVFRSSPQLIEFLRYVVETTLRGEGNRLKAFTIATSVLGRTSNFDSQSDPIVRVEATRLRHALDRYYAGPGANETILINIPRGTYVPVIRRNDSNFIADNASSKIARRLLQPK